MSEPDDPTRLARADRFIRATLAGFLSGRARVEIRIGPPVRGDSEYAENRQVPVWRFQCRRLG